MERNSRKVWLPNLYYDHPGYFKVVLALLLTHLGLGLDGIFRWGPAHTPLFIVLRSVVDGHLWIVGAVHIVITVCMVVGLYRPMQFWLVRVGSALSLMLFNVCAFAFAYAAILYDLSFYSAIASVGLSLSSAAALYEPPIQSAWKVSK